VIERGGFQRRKSICSTPAILRWMKQTMKSRASSYCGARSLRPHPGSSHESSPDLNTKPLSEEQSR
jgi:hypothetical protein